MWRTSFFLFTINFNLAINICVVVSFSHTLNNGTRIKFSMNKKGSITNLQMSLVNAIALSSILANGNVSGVGEDGTPIVVSTSLIAQRAGYKTLTSYHHSLLIELSELGWLEEHWIDRRRKGYMLTTTAWSFLGNNVTITERVND